MWRKGTAWHDTRHQLVRLVKRTEFETGASKNEKSTPASLVRISRLLVLPTRFARQNRHVRFAEFSSGKMSSRGKYSEDTRQSLETRDSARVWIYCLVDSRTTHFVNYVSPFISIGLNKVEGRKLKIVMTEID